jgi:hypothetical protein
MEAALRLGIDLDDLYVRPLSYFVSRARDHKLNLAKVLLEHYEGRRTAAVAEVVGERKRVIAEGAKLLAATGGGAAAEGVDPVALDDLDLGALGLAPDHQHRRHALLYKGPHPRHKGSDGFLVGRNERLQHTAGCTRDMH